MTELNKVFDIIEDFSAAQEQEFIVSDEELEKHREKCEFLNNKIKEWHEKAEKYEETEHIYMDGQAHKYESDYILYNIAEVIGRED